MKKNKVTIYDIADKLGVSATTVSRSLNDHYSISQKTKSLVRETAKDMGYVPNNLAASLRKKKTNAIAVMVPWVNRPFISSLISGIEEVANNEGYSVIISQSCDSFEREKANVKSFFSARVDGLIISLAMETEDFSHFQTFLDNNIPVVLADRTGIDLPVDKVTIDNFSAAFKATEHLIKAGCRRIVHFGGSAVREIYRQRKEGYLSALARHGIPNDPDLIIHNLLGADEGIENARKIMAMNQPPDGIFSANDTAAVHALLELKKAGWDIPNDIAIVGFNDDPISSIVEPKLTTISHPALEIGRTTARRLIKRICANEKMDPETIIIPTELLQRASSKKLAPDIVNT